MKRERFSQRGIHAAVQLWKLVGLSNSIKTTVLRHHVLMIYEPVQYGHSEVRRNVR